MTNAISRFFAEKWTDIQDIYFNYVGVAIDLLLQFTAWATSILAHTPIEIWSGFGFKHTYNYISFLALISIACIWAYVGLRVYWGLSSWDDFGVVVSRTATVLIVTKAIPYLLVFFAALTNRIAYVFASDYGTIRAVDILNGDNGSTL